MHAFRRPIARGHPQGTRVRPGAGVAGRPRDRQRGVDGALLLDHQHGVDGTLILDGQADVDDALLRLQSLAGNRAVVELLALQRAPAPAPPRTPSRAGAQPDPAAAAALTAAHAERAGDPAAAATERLAAARALVDSDWLDAIAWDGYRVTGGLSSAIATQIWLDQLGLADLDPAVLSRSDRASFTALERHLAERITRIIAAHFTAAARTAAQPDGRQRIIDDVDRLWPEIPGWDAGFLADRLFHDQVGPGRIADLRDPASSAAAGYWTALQAAADAALKTKREHDFAAPAIAALDPAEVAAVRAILEPMTTWIATALDTDQLADRVAASLGRPTARTDPAWQRLRGRLVDLVPVVEVEIIAATMPQENPVGPERWAHLRQRWLNTISKPVWRYWQDNIVDTTIFGRAVRRSNAGEGLHRQVAEALRQVEQSAVRLAGVSSVSDLTNAQGAKGPHMVQTRRGQVDQPVTTAGTEFRFEPVSQFAWMLGSQHLSFHGTGRALDFRSATNPAVKGNAHQLISVLGGGELSEQTIDRSKLGRWAGTLERVDERAAEIEAQAAVEADPSARDALTAEAGRFRDARRTAPETNATATALRDRATLVYGRIRDIETTFQAAWKALKDAGGDDASLVAALQQQVATARADAEAEVADLRTKPVRAAEAESGLPNLLTQAERKLARVKTLETALAGDTSVGLTKTQKALVKETGDAAASGLNDLPEWLVQAFSEQGWSWGGTWVGFSDAMHFDYMGPVADVIAQ